jgi:hypothetical protein
MTEIKKVGAQGDLLFVRVEEVPRGLTAVPPEGGRYVLARGDSASGDHSVPAEGVTYVRGTDDRTAYLDAAVPVTVTHGRAVDTHAPVTLAPGAWLVRRQREHTPEGFRLVAD